RPTSTPFPYTTLFRSRGGRRKTSPRRTTGRARGVPDRQAGRASDADPHRLDRRAPLDARLFSAHRVEYAARWIVQLAAEHEPARDRKSTRLNSSHVSI